MCLTRVNSLNKSVIHASMYASILFIRRLKGRKHFSQTQPSRNTLYISALQNLLFCVPKAAVLHGKSVGFASQKSRFCNAKAQLSLFNRFIFTKVNASFVLNTYIYYLRF